MNLRRIAAVTKKEAREIIRDPITVWVALLMPLIMLFLFGYALSLDVKNVALGVWDSDNTPDSRGLIDAFAQSGYFTVAKSLKDDRDLNAALQTATIKLALIIPEGFARRIARAERPQVQVIVDGTFSNTAQIVANYADAIVANAATQARPLVEPEIRVWYNPEMRSANYIVPGLFAVILLAFPPLLTCLAVVREKESGSIQQVFASPLSGAEFIAGKLIPYGLIAFLQVLLVIGFGLVWFDVPFRGDVVVLLGISFIYVFCTVGLGLLVSTITRRQVVAMLLVLMVTLMPSFLFSGFLFPIFTMPYLMQGYASLFPGRYFVELSRDVVMKGHGLIDVWQNVAALLAYTLAVFALAAWRFRKKVA